MIPERPNPSPTPTADGARQERRSLPTRAVTDDNFDDAYVDFIMYCNPTVASDTDATELRKIFRSPPKSDGKSFSTFTLFQLIEKLEQKEIKTWAQLALDLGVEAPSAEKGHSAQKVQQYAVRLKVSGLQSRVRLSQTKFPVAAKIFALENVLPPLKSLIYILVLVVNLTYCSGGCMLCMSMPFLSIL